MEGNQYNNEKLYTLRSECSPRQLSTGGNKNDLVARLVEHDKINRPDPCANTFDDETDPSGFLEMEAITAKYKKLLDEAQVTGQADINSQEARLKRRKGALQTELTKIVREKSVACKAVHDRVARLHEKNRAANKRKMESPVNSSPKGLQPFDLGSQGSNEEGQSIGGYTSGDNSDGDGGSSDVRDPKKAKMIDESAVEYNKPRPDSTATDDEEPDIDSESHLVEKDPIEPTLGRVSYLLLSSENGTTPTRGSAIKVLKIQLANFGPLHVRVDAAAYFVLFPDNNGGGKAMLDCFDYYDEGIWIAGSLFNFKLVWQRY